MAYAPDSPQNADAAPSWLAQNAPSLIVCLAVLSILVYKFDVEGLWSIAKAAIGLSVVIFIHELGHFLVAKWCDVHATMFSIGFGPPIPGCTFQWGETTYKLALFPLGGYVQMVGQIDGDETSDGSEDDPRSYRNKNVWQRMAIISAGVIMNVILAVVCFVTVFLWAGKDRGEPAIAYIDTGAPAYTHGIRSGDVITMIGSIKHPYFEDIKRQVMATGPNEPIQIGLRHGNDTRVIEVIPRKDRKDLAPMIGFAPAPRLQLKYKRYLDPTLKSPTWPLSPAARAEPAFEYADRIVASSYDPDHPEKVKDLPRDPRLPKPGEPDYPGYEQCDYFEFARRMQDLAGKPVTIVVERSTGETTTKLLPIVVQPSFNLSLGIAMRMGEITAIRTGSPADGKIQPRERENNRAGDKIVGISVKIGDRTIVWGDTFKPLAGMLGRAFIWADTHTLDPMRLPYDLRLAMAKAREGSAQAGDAVSAPPEPSHRSEHAGGD